MTGLRLATSAHTSTDPSFYMYVWFDHEAREASKVESALRADLLKGEKEGWRWNELRPTTIGGKPAAVFEQDMTANPPPRYKGADTCDCIRRWYIAQWQDSHVLQIEFHALAPAAYHSYLPIAERIVGTVRSV